MPLFPYITMETAERYAYISVPRAILFEDQFKGLSLESKIIYSLMLDRTSLSRENKWVDALGRVYINYTDTEIAGILNMSKPTVVKAVKSLEGHGLIERVSLGANKPLRIYVKDFSCAEITRMEVTDLAKAVENFPAAVNSGAVSAPEQPNSCIDNLINLPLKENNFTPHSEALSDSLTSSLTHQSEISDSSDKLSDSFMNIDNDNTSCADNNASLSLKENNFTPNVRVKNLYSGVKNFYPGVKNFYPNNTNIINLTNNPDYLKAAKLGEIPKNAQQGTEGIEIKMTLLDAPVAGSEPLTLCNLGVDVEPSTADSLITEKEQGQMYSPKVSALPKEAENYNQGSMGVKGKEEVARAASIYLQSHSSDKVFVDEIVSVANDLTAYPGIKNISRKQYTPEQINQTLAKITPEHIGVMVSRLMSQSGLGNRAGYIRTLLVTIPNEPVAVKRQSGKRQLESWEHDYSDKEWYDIEQALLQKSMGL